MFAVEVFVIMDEIARAELLVSPPSSSQKPPKSPPLAFEPTPNDALAPLSSPQHDNNNNHSKHTFSPSQREILGMSSESSLVGGTAHLAIIMEQQSHTISLLHEAFASERKIWALEKAGLYERIASLEKLLKAKEGNR